jgi:uncharacterized phosphosugar-binding protein
MVVSPRRTIPRFAEQVTDRIATITARALSGAFDEAINLVVACVKNGGVIQAFGTGHSEAFAMEMAGRAGGLIPSNAIRLRDLVLLGRRPDAAVLAGSGLERDPAAADELWSLYRFDPADLFIIASNSGVNGAIVQLALRAKAEGHQLIAVTSLAHSMAVEPRHPSGKRLCDLADCVIDNLAPYGDATIEIAGGAVKAGAVSSLTAAYIAQILTLSTADALARDDQVPPIYLSANVPGGDQHNSRIEELYGARIQPYGQCAGSQCAGLTVQPRGEEV